MDVNFLQAALGTVMLGALILSIAGWIAALVRISSGRSVLAYTTAFRVPWKFIDIAIVFVLAFIAIGVAQGIVVVALEIDLSDSVEEMDIGTQLNVIGAFSIAVLGILPFAVWLVSLRSGASLRDLGWSLDHVVDDLRIGVLAFAMLSVPVLIVQYTLVQFFPSQHPFIKIIVEDPQPKYFGIMFFAAVIQAPLAEEFLFRGLIQGWLEKIIYRRAVPRVVHQPAAFSEGYEPDNYEPDYEVAELVPDQLGTSFDDLPPLAEEVVEHESIEPDLDSPPLPDSRFLRWLPIIISSILFAGAHYSHGPDPIPLFVLAMGLGYLYRQTHRLLPCIVVHVVLNGFSVLQLLLVALSGEPLPE